jgi:hypothetical protein
VLAGGAAWDAAGAGLVLGALLAAVAAVFESTGARLAAAGSAAWFWVLAWLALVAAWSWLLGHPVVQSTTAVANSGNSPNLAKKLISLSS